MKYLALAKTYWWAGWAIVLMMIGYLVLRPQKTLILTEYKDRIVYRTACGGATSGHASGGTTVVSPDGVTNTGGEVDWSASYYSDSEFIEDKALVQREVVPVVLRPSVLLGASALYANGWYAELGLGVRFYKALYLQGAVGTKNFIGIDSGRAGLILAF